MPIHSMPTADDDADRIRGWEHGSRDALDGRKPMTGLRGFYAEGYHEGYDEYR